MICSSFLPRPPFNDDSPGRTAVVRIGTVWSPVCRMGVLAAMLLILLQACDSSTDPVTPSEQESWISMYHSDDSLRLRLNDYASTDIDGEAAIPLSALVDTNFIPPFYDRNGSAHDARVLYAYHFIGSDGFSASVNRGYANNIWEHLTVGYIMLRSRNLLFPKAVIDLPGAYNIKDADKLYLRRKIDVVFPDSTVFVEIGKLPVTTVINTQGVAEAAVAFDALIRAVLPDPGGYSYTLRAIDGAGPDALTWQQFSTGYWLLQSERSMFTDPGLSSGRYRLSAVDRIIVSR
jgi:hypothetical protein